MSLEEEHQELHSRGEWVKFLILVVILLGTVLVVALARPLIFEHIVPAVMGWNQPQSEDNASETVPAAMPEEEAPVAVETPAIGGDEDALPTPTAEAPTPVPEAPEPQTYRVAPGDNLTTIARRFGITVDDLVRANQITNPNRITPGDILVIPAP